VITAGKKLIATTDAYEPLTKLFDALAIGRQRKRSRGE
jgi:hypothetical protein